MNVAPEETVAAEESQIYSRQIDQQRIQDSLWVLAICFDICRTNPGAVNEFIRTYIQKRTVTRPLPPERTMFGDTRIGISHHFNLASHRSASKSRDYKFATMPQFSWYLYPRHAQKMILGQIFLDLHKQASCHNLAFVCWITASMTDPTATLEKAQLPSVDQPKPKSLGGFSKLFGERADFQNTMVPYAHVTTAVNVLELEHVAQIDYKAYLGLIESAMLFSQTWRHEAHLGGELLAYGSFTHDIWKVSLVDAISSGWCRFSGEGDAFLAIEDGDEMTIVPQPGIMY